MQNSVFDFFTLYVFHVLSDIYITEKLLYHEESCKCFQ